MVHLSLVAFLALAFSGVASAAPGLGDIRARGSRSFYTCTGTWLLASRGPTCGTQQYHHVAAGTNKIISVNISPDPPVPGEHFSVTVKASAPEQILVSLPSNCDEGCWLIAEFRRVQTLSSPSVGVVNSCGMRPSKFATCTPPILAS